MREGENTAQILKETPPEILSFQNAVMSRKQGL